MLFIHLWIIFYIIGSIFGGWQQLFIMIFGGGEKVFVLTQYSFFFCVNLSFILCWHQCNKWKINFGVGLLKTDGPCLIHYRDVFHSEVTTIQFSASSLFLQLLFYGLNILLICYDHSGLEQLCHHWSMFLLGNRHWAFLVRSTVITNVSNCYFPYFKDIFLESL